MVILTETGNSSTTGDLWHQRFAMELPLGTGKDKLPLSGPSLLSLPLFQGLQAVRIPAGSYRGGGPWVIAALQQGGKAAGPGLCLGMAPGPTVAHFSADLLLEIFPRVYCFCCTQASKWKFPLGGGRKISGKTSKAERIKDRINWATTSVFRTKNEKVIIHS